MMPLELEAGTSSSSSAMRKERYKSSDSKSEKKYLSTELPTLPDSAVSPWKVAKDFVPVTLQMTLHSILFSMPLIAVIYYLRLCYFHSHDIDRLDKLHARTLSSNQMVRLVNLGMSGGTILPISYFFFCFVFGFRTGAARLSWVIPCAMIGFILWYVGANYFEAFLLNRPLTNILPAWTNIPAAVSFLFFSYRAAKYYEVSLEIPKLAKRFTRVYMGLIITLVFYIFVMPRMWFRKGSTEIERAVIRVVIHPLMFESANIVLRMFIRNTNWGSTANKGMVSLFVSPVMIVASQYGRFLIAASTSVVAAMLISVAVGAVECVLRLSSGRRDWLLVRILKGKEAARQFLENSPNKQLRADLVCLDFIIELNSIITGSVLQYAFQLTYSSGDSVTLSRLVVNIVGQFLIEFVVGFTIALLEELHGGIPVRETWKNRGGGHKTLYATGIFTSLFITFFYYVNALTWPDAGFVSFRDRA